jgi:CHAT domain-containing protein
MPSIVLSALFCISPVSAKSDTLEPLRLQQQAIKRIERFIEHFKRTGDRTSLLPELKQAELELAVSEEEFKRRGNLAGAALSLMKWADSQRLQTHWDRALELYGQALTVAQKAEHPEYQAKTLKGMAKAEFLGLNRLGDAVSHLEQALALTAQFEDKGLQFDVLDELAQIEIRNGDLARASDLLSRAFAVVEPLNDRARLFYGYSDRAEIYQKIAEKCDFQRTFRICLEAVDLAKADYEQALAHARFLGHVGLAKLTEDFLRALENRRALIRSREQFDQTVLGARLFHPEATEDVLVHERFGGGTVTIPPAVIAAIQHQGGLARAGDARSHYLQGIFLAMQGERDASLRAYLQAVDLLEQDRRKLRDEEGRGGYFEDKVEFYYAPIVELLDRRRIVEAFELMERSRARGMADMLANKSLGIAGSQEKAMFGEAMSLNARIGVLQKEFIEHQGRPDREKYRDRIEKAKKQIQELEAEYRSLLHRMEANAPKAKQLLISQPTSLQQMQELSKNEQFDLVEYLSLESQLIVWHVHGDAVQVKSVFLPRSEVISKVAALRKNLVDGAGQAPFDAKVANELFLFLIQPVLKEIKTERLVIVPHEDLNYIPFQALQNPLDKQYLGERFQISYAPSATILAGLSRVSALNNKNLLAVADPGIEDHTGEARAIAAVYPGTSKIVTEALAKETDVKDWVSHYNVLHLSVHGRFNQAEPLLSSLQLGRDDQNDGQLTGAEMFGLALDETQLVVLSACETGQVEATHANEVLGMVRALLYAGAKTLVLSSWQVDSVATARWMEVFYRSLRDVSPPEAARKALIAVKSDPKYQHPYYWSAFLLTGR